MASHINQPSRFAASILSNVKGIFLAPAPNHAPANTVTTTQTNAPPYHSDSAAALPDSTSCSVLAELTAGMPGCIPKSHIYLTGTFSTTKGCPSTQISCIFNSLRGLHCHSNTLYFIVRLFSLTGALSFTVYCTDVKQMGINGERRGAVTEL